MDLSTAAACRFVGQPGHYESWFLRANSPAGDQALWVRYTIFSPRSGSSGKRKKDGSHEAQGELWAIYFGDGPPVSAYQQFPISNCHFLPVQGSGAGLLDLAVGNSTLSFDRAQGRAEGAAETVDWDLQLHPEDDTPLLFLSPRLYELALPKAKALVLQPRVRFQGTLHAGGKSIEVNDWVGSLNHNWGSEHTSRYAWGQVADFAESPRAFFEVATAQVDLGPLSSPWMTPMVLRLRDEEYRLSALLRSMRNEGSYGATQDGLPGSLSEPTWRFSGETTHRMRDGAKKRVSIEGTISASGERFAVLPYRNPPGGTKYCLNTKVARCELKVQVGDKVERLSSNKAAFEILAAKEP